MSSDTVLHTIPDCELHQPCTTQFFATFASQLNEWKLLAPYLGISEVKIEEIEIENKGIYEQKYQLLLEWQEQSGSQKATYHNLVEALKRYERDWHEHIALLVCAEHLRRSYLHRQQPLVTPWPQAEHNVYISPTLVIDTTPGMQPATSEREIKPEDLFDIQGSHGKTLLLEGPAGSGKSTFVWYASKKWAEGELFPELDLLITLDLADPLILSATCLADLIPHPDKELREAVASTLVETGGQRVGFLADGLDQVPQKEQCDPFLFKVLNGVTLPNASILVTSRPRVAVTNATLPLISSKVRISPFSPDQIELFFSQAEANKPSGILEKFHSIEAKQPTVSGFCKLPLHAAMLVFLICVVGAPLVETELTTLTNIFECFIRALLLRHIRMHYSSLGVKRLKELQHLPPQISTQFNLLCKLAYACISDNKTILDTETIKRVADIDPKSLDTLSVMKERAIYTREGTQVLQHSFLHQSLQEFLAAQHLSMCSEDTQVSLVEQLLNVSPPTLVFLSGILKNGSQPLMSTLADHCKTSLQSMATKPMATLAHMTYPNLIVSIINAVYETQSVKVAHLVTQKISFSLKNGVHLQIGCPNTEFVHDKVGFSMRTGTFTAQVLSCPNVTHIHLNLMHCLLEDSEIGTVFDALLSTLSKPDIVNLGDQQQKSLHFYLGGNRISHHCTKVICQSILKLPYNSLVLLDLQFSWEPSHTDIRAALKAIVEATCSLSPPCISGINLSGDAITPDMVWHLVLMATTGKYLKFISLDQNQLGVSIQLLAGALEFSTTIDQMIVSSCCIDSSGVAALGRCLQRNSKLCSLDISFNSYSAESLTEFLTLQRDSLKSGLKKLTISHDLTEEQDTIITEINAARSLASQPNLVILHAKKRDISVESVKEASQAVIKAKENKRAFLRLANQQILYYYTNFGKFMNEKNVHPFWILRSLSQAFQPLAPGESSRTITEDVLKVKEYCNIVLNKLESATDEQMKSVSKDMELEEQEMKDQFSVLVKFCDAALDYIQNLAPIEVEEIEAQLSPHGMSENCPMQ